jgi:pyridoxamine 5'-phosphate oxidase
MWQGPGEMTDPVQADVERRRRRYAGGPLDLSDLAPDPLLQFERWYAQAIDAGLTEPNAMTLSTVDAAGRPQSRYVLLRGLDERGFRFYTNFASAKARELDAHPQAALTFGWLEVHRSVRVTGRAERVDADESDAYFATRPRDSRIGAWASPQSAVLESRGELDARVADVTARFEAQEDIPRPEFWGGYLVVPEVVEFWQGRPSRLHDRLRYVREPGGAWAVERLGP